MIVTIDGPAGSGKSTAARGLAARLEIPYLDTGAMYRAVALRALRDGVPLEDPAALTAAAREADIDVDCGPTQVFVRLDGQDVSEAIRSLEVSEATRPVARTQGVREVLIEKQREIGRRLGSLVTEGRDQGSVVFPNADLKVLLDASLDTRARRRHEELIAKGQKATIPDVRGDLARRDDNDRRQWEPLLEDPGMAHVPTDDMTAVEVVDFLAAKVHERESHSS